MYRKLSIMIGSIALSLALMGTATADEKQEDARRPPKAEDKDHDRDDRAAKPGKGPKAEDKDHDKDDGTKKAHDKKTLPSEASARAHDVAFGQQGRHERALHAAKEAARDEAEHGDHRPGLRTKG